MQVLRDAASIRGAVTRTTLGQLMGQRLSELSEYDDEELTELLTIIVIDPGDRLSAIDAELGFQLLDRPIDVVEAHEGWYELTIVLSDDGAGVLLYVPMNPGVDPRLLSMCARWGIGAASP